MSICRPHFLIDTDYLEPTRAQYVKLAPPSLLQTTPQSLLFLPNPLEKERVWEANTPCPHLDKEKDSFLEILSMMNFLWDNAFSFRRVKNLHKLLLNGACTSMRIGIIILLFRFTCVTCFILKHLNKLLAKIVNPLNSPFLRSRTLIGNHIRPLIACY